MRESTKTPLSSLKKQKRREKREMLPKLKIENMVLATHLKAKRTLRLEEINKLIFESRIGQWEIIREDSNPALKIKIPFDERSVCTLIWIKSNKVQFMGVKKKSDALEAYAQIMKEIRKFARGVLI